ncbi:energy transducer TonB [Alterisphingorhabdus coralli]|uniref:TonB family protein n=1 Tax=Alterisphingorhabdus coralli TaxID=3071408 RepID=A0AA97I1H8_9SPHN|nr:TonB family protein [Parasphingorhabdus sp. SCSIO 66989]WOE75408.1 TonB family protein [Parasphingorhabdus sp. SCSIO 66989]
MSYADQPGFGASNGDRVKSAIMVAALQGSVIAALVLVPIAVVSDDPIIDGGFTARNIPATPPPEPVDPVEKPKEASTAITTPIPPRPMPNDNALVVPPITDLDITPPLIGDPGAENIIGPENGSGTDSGVRLPPPVIIAPKRDPRYARFFQPAYPTQKLRSGEEGRVRISVLVAADGRVKAVKQIAASDLAFWRATERQALRRWRFIPGTRDGEPDEQWIALTVNFTIND